MSRKRLILERYAYAPTYTQGKLDLEGPEGRQFLCWTIERPWRDNAPGDSCIPDGEGYYMAPWVRPDGRRAFIVHGGTVCRLPQDVDGNPYTRCLILFHPANRPSELQGCIAPGMGHIPGQVTMSREAMTKLQAELKDYFAENATIPLKIRPVLGTKD